MILEGEEVTFECLARGGKPAAEVLGALGDEQEDVELEVVTEEETEAADGLIDVMKEFRLTPSRADCGKWVKCSASQRDGEGEVVFEAASLAKQVMVARRGGQAGAGGLCAGDGGLPAPAHGGGGDRGVQRGDRGARRDYGGWRHCTVCFGFI